MKTNIIAYMPKNDAESLAEFVARIMSEEDLSSYDVAKRSGKQINQSHVNRIKNGDVKQPKSDKLKALAKGLGVPEEELFAVVRGVNPNKTNITNERLVNMSLNFDALPASQKEKAELLIEVLDREIERMKSEK